MVHKTVSRPATQTPSPEQPAGRSHGYFSILVDSVFPLSETDASQREQPREELEGLSVQDLLAAYACMRLSREIDKMETLLHRSGNLWFSIAGAGKEALNVATGMHMRADDIKFPYYRDHALALWSGITLLDVLRQGTASRFDSILTPRTAEVLFPERTNLDRSGRGDYFLASAFLAATTAS